jgi:fumarate hydratase class II
MEYRAEHDTMGEVMVPADKYKFQTERRGTISNWT